MRAAQRDRQAAAVLPKRVTCGGRDLGLDSGSMVKLLQGRREAYEFVLLDSPPATVVSDIIALAAHVRWRDRDRQGGGSTSGRAVVELRRGLTRSGRS